MTKITPIADDLGNQSLKSDNRVSPTAKAVSSVAPKRGIHNLSGSAHLKENTRLQRRLSDRRDHERRKRNIPVLLDTRSSHERRKKQRRHELAKRRSLSGVKGIDIKV
ncbi:MAG: hypothetical protein OQK73_09915 [Gammaproteobacteria bacterium]|nr:hypothetical protein [Gammaproteobacteria bacterium]